MCASSKPRYGKSRKSSRLTDVYKKLHDGRFDQDSLEAISAKDEERELLALTKKTEEDRGSGVVGTEQNRMEEEVWKDFQPFDHSTERARAFQVTVVGQSLVFEETDRCAKCFKLYNYLCDDCQGKNAFRPGSCAEDLCHIYCKRVPMAAVDGDPDRSFF